jgi:very-short-patch-repair endonuclease
MRHTDIDTKIELLAGKQYGAFNRQQAFELGASERFVARRLQHGAWVRAAPAVYVLARSAGTWRRQCKIAELSAEDAAIAGLAAAALHEFPGFKPGRVEIVTAINAPCRHPRAIVHRYAGARVTAIDGIRVTTIAQTLFDNAMVLSPWRLERTIDDLLVAKRVTVADLDERLDFYDGSRRPGLPAIRPLIVERRADGWVPAESELEALLVKLLERLPGLPRVERQASFAWRPQLSARVDALLPDYRLIVEADGRRWHTRVADFDNDRWRDNEATAHGYRTLRFTWVHLHDFADASLDQLVRTIGGMAAA